MTENLNEFKIGQPPTDGITSLQFSPNSSQYLLVSSWDSSVRLYDINANTMRIQYKSVKEGWRDVFAALRTWQLQKDKLRVKEEIFFFYMFMSLKFEGHWVNLSATENEGKALFWHLSHSSEGKALFWRLSHSDTLSLSPTVVSLSEFFCFGAVSWISFLQLFRREKFFSVQFRFFTMLCVLLVLLLGNISGPGYWVALSGYPYHYFLLRPRDINFKMHPRISIKEKFVGRSVRRSVSHFRQKRRKLMISTDRALKEAVQSTICVLSSTSNSRKNKSGLICMCSYVHSF